MNSRTNLDNHVLVDVALDVSGYNYYGYLDSGRDSRYVIMREKTDATEYRFAFGKGSDYTTAWGTKASLTYILPSQLGGSN